MPQEPFQDEELSEILRTMQLGKLEFRRLGIACCHRIVGSLHDRRLRKALRQLEKSAEHPGDDRPRRDAYNAARPVYLELHDKAPRNWTVEVSAACTLVCAAMEEPNGNLLGNFRATLEKSEGLTQEQVRQIEVDLLREVLMKAMHDG